MKKLILKFQEFRLRSKLAQLDIDILGGAISAREYLSNYNKLMKKREIVKRKLAYVKKK